MKKVWENILNTIRMKILMGIRYELQRRHFAGINICFFAVASMLIMIVGTSRKVCMADVPLEIDIDLSGYEDYYGEDDDTETEDTEDTFQLKINKTELEVKIGKEKQLKVSGASSKVTWKSSDTDIGLRRCICYVFRLARMVQNRRKIL